MLIMKDLIKFDIPFYYIAVLENVAIVVIIMRHIRFYGALLHWCQRYFLRKRSTGDHKSIFEKL